jgi:hypothetical protein
MKGLFSILGVFVFIANSSLAQVEQTKRVNLPKYNIFGLDEYTIEATVVDLYVLKYIIKKKGDTENQKEFTLSPNTIESFESSFNRYVGELGNQDPNLKAKAISPAFADEAKRLFYYFIASERAIESLEDAPDAGKLCYNQNMQVFRDLYSIKDFNKEFRELRKKLLMAEKNTNSIELRWLSREKLDEYDLENKNSKEIDKIIGEIKSKFDTDFLQQEVNNSNSRFLTKETQVELKKKTNEDEALWTKRLKEFIKDSVANKVVREIITKYKSARYSDNKYAGLMRSRFEGKNQWNDEIKKYIKERRDAEVTSKIELAKHEFELENQNLINAVTKISSLRGILAKRNIELNTLIETANKLSEKISDVDLRKRKLTEVLSNINVPDIKKSKEHVFDNYSYYLDTLTKKIDSVNAQYNTKKEEITNAARLLNPLQSPQDQQDILDGIKNLKTDSALLKIKLAKLEDLKTNIEREYSEIRTEEQLLANEFDKNKMKIDPLRSQIDETKINFDKLRNDSTRNYLDRIQKCDALAEVKKNQLISSFEVERIQLEFNDGFMENIVVEGQLKYGQELCSPVQNGLSNYLKFNNRYPIGFSRKKDIDRYKDYYQLFAKKAGRSYKLPLSTVFPEFIEELRVDRRDFSPDDQVITLDFENGQCKVLKKEQYYKIFEAKVYSDFVGFFGEDKPNGLVQTEISKHVNLLTYKRAARFFGGRLIFGGLGYIEPEVTISKIETNNKRLELEYIDKVVNDQYAPIKYASTINLKQFQNFSTGFDLNTFVLDLPAFKSTFYCDLGFRCGRTSIVDTIRTFENNQISKSNVSKTYGVNTLEVYPKAIWEIRSDERYSFVFSYSKHWFYLRDLRFEQVANNEDFQLNQNDPEDVKYRLNKIVLLAKLKPNVNTKGTLFFRYQMNWQQGYWKSVFSQAQVGYSFYILANRNQ